MAFKMQSPLARKVKKVKAKGGGTKKVCLPKAKIASMSKAERQRVINAKRSAASKGKYKRYYHLVRTVFRQRLLLT